MRTIALKETASRTRYTAPVFSTWPESKLITESGICIFSTSGEEAKVLTIREELGNRADSGGRLQIWLDSSG
jgi:hypothetical protein